MHSEKLRIWLHASCNVAMVIKKQRMSTARHVARMVKIIHPCKIFVVKSEE